ncbi:hypothetical protein [Emticicia sp. W12TSBA100-4]|uniref:hypothetical protein n=1 Tax=Emticicia sp. W12TSBA100-4 TaxID=3160965 RepID=UPI0033067599
MKLKNSNYTFESEDPVFIHNGKAYNANHLDDKQIGELVMDGCKVFKKEKTAAQAASSEQK